MAAITKLSQKSGIKWRATINMAGVRPFSRNFITKANAKAWVKKTEKSLESAKIEGNNAARKLELSTLITEVTNSRPLNHSTLTALTWWKDHYGHELCLMLDKTIIREARNDLLACPMQGRLRADFDSLTGNRSTDMR
jgi:hypothetical protein